MEFQLEKAVEVLRSTPATLQALLGQLSEEWTSSIADFKLRISDCEELTPSAGDPDTEIRDPHSQIPNREWQPFDIVGHLIHGEETDWIPRARIILAQDGDRTFIPFDRFAQFNESKGRSLDQLLEEFAKLRSENLDTLRSWNLASEQLDLEGIHPELGTVTLRQLLATWVVHDLNHIRQLVIAMSRQYSGEVGVWKEYLSILK